MKDLKKIIFNNWGLMRIIRFALAIFVLVEAFFNYDVMFGVIGFVLLLQSLFNIGCCNAGVCYTENAGKANENSELIYEEIKVKGN